MAWYDRLRSEGAGAFDAMRQALPLFAREPYARPGDPAAQRRALEFDATSPESGVDDIARLPGTGHSLDVEAGKRGYRIAGRLQARAAAERGYALSPDELATTLGATTTLPGEVIARLARADSQDRLASGAERARADDPGKASPGLLLHHDALPGEHLIAAGQDDLVAETVGARASSDRTAAQLAAESFPCTAANAVRAAAQANPSPVRRMAVQNVRQPGHSV